MASMSFGMRSLKAYLSQIDGASMHAGGTWYRQAAVCEDC